MDDDPDVRESLIEALQCSGHDVLEAADGETALVVARQRRPDVILLDLNLPGTDGYEVARQLRQESRGTRALVVAMTGYSRDEVLEKAGEDAFDEHLRKPCEPEQLDAILATAPVLNRTPVAIEGVILDGAADRLEFTNVCVVSANRLVLMCRVGPRVVAVRLRSVLPGSEIAATGDRGRLVLTREAAISLGLA